MDLSGIGVKPGPLVSAFFGAIVYAATLRVKNPIQISVIVFVGMGTSYSLGPLVVAKLRDLGFSSVDDAGLQNAAGFIIGLTAMIIANGILGLVRRFFKGEGGEPPSAATPVPLSETPK